MAAPGDKRGPLSIMTNFAKKVRDTVSPVALSAATNLATALNPPLRTPQLVSPSGNGNGHGRRNGNGEQTILVSVASDFTDNNLPFNRPMILDIIRKTVPDERDRAGVAAEILPESWNVSDSRVRQLLGGVDAAGEDYSIPEGVRAFYIRSTQFTVTNPVLLMDTFERRFHHPVFVEKLRAMTVECATRQAGTVNLRYIGTCLGPEAPADRINEDLKAKTTSLFGKVSLCIAELEEDGTFDVPHVWTVTELPTLREDDQEKENLQKDFAERVLISVFGYDSLINVQRGGFYPEYVPTDEDKVPFRHQPEYMKCGSSNVDPNQTLFQSQTTKVTLNLNAIIIGSGNHQVKNTIREHFQNVFAFIEKTPGTLGNQNMHFHEMIKEATIKQATPITHNMRNGTLVVLVGEYRKCKRHCDYPFIRL
ncbi:hypothetical protein HKX48_006580 [Thoreauomyces humboldtii]|nr:hypothetical protein HKX48_006580 [Thoreauomyces humboldtii]